MAYRWQFDAPWDDNDNQDWKEEYLAQAAQMEEYFRQNPQIPQNMSNISKTFGFLPKDVQVAGAMIGLTQDNPEWTSLVDKFMNKETSWWDKTKSIARGAVRGAVVGMESASQFTKKYGTGLMKYYSKREMNPMLAFSGIGTLIPLIDPEGLAEVRASAQAQGPTLATRALEELKAGRNVNLGEGYFGNSTVAEDTEIYKELVGRGADPEEVRGVIQDFYGKPISQLEFDSREGESGTYRGRKGTVKLSPGRVTAVEVFEPGTRGFNIMSGIIDGAYTIFTDPTTYVGAGFAKAGKVARTFNKTVEKSNAGLIDKAVRKVVHTPTADEYFNTQVGDNIAQMFADSKSYDEVEILMSGGGRKNNQVKDALLYKKLRDTTDKQEIKSILSDAIKDPKSGVNDRFDANSLLFKGSLSRLGAGLRYGDKNAAAGYKTAMRLNGQNSLFNRLFDEFPAPQLSTDNLNDTFFELKDWMKFSKVDDDVANKALDRIADAITDDTLKELEGLPADLQRLNMVLDIYSGEGGVLRHVMDKYEALGLPKEVVNQVGKFVASVDEARKYFYTKYGEEAWSGQKIDIEDTLGNDLFKIDFSLKESIGALNRIVDEVNLNIKGVKNNQQLQQLFIDEVEGVGRISADIAEADIIPNKIISGGNTGVDLEALRVGKELGLETGGRGTPGLNTSSQGLKSGRYDDLSGELTELGLDDPKQFEIDNLKKQQLSEERQALSDKGIRSALTVTLSQIRIEGEKAAATLKGFQRGKKALSELSPAASEEDILKRIKVAVAARESLQKLNITLQGKQTRGVTQAGKRIKETSVQVPNDEINVLEEIAGLEVQTRILRHVRGLKETAKGIDYEDFDMVGFQKEMKRINKEEVTLTDALAKRRSQYKARQKDLNDTKREKKIEKIQKEINDLERADYGDAMPEGKFFVRRSIQNVVDSDVTVIVYNSATAPAGKGTRGTFNYAQRGNWNTNAKVKPGIYPKGDKPLIVIDANETLTRAQVNDIQALLKKYKTVNVAGPRNYANTDELQTILKSVFVKSKQGYIDKQGFKVLNDERISPQQILQFFEDKGVDAERMDDIINSLRKEAKMTEIAQVTGRPTAHLISEYLAGGNVPLPDARLFLRVFSPAREFMLRISGRGDLVAKSTIKLENKHEVVVSDFEKLLSKPVKELYDLQMKDNRNAFETMKLMTKSARRSFQLSKDEQSVKELSQGWAGMLGDFYMNKAWKPFILLRGAWTARVVGEEQIRMWAADLDNVFTHPISAFAWIAGKPRKKVLERIGKGELDVDEVIKRAKGAIDIRDKQLLADSLEHQSAMSMSHGGILDSDKLKRTFSFKRVKKGEERYYTSATSEIMQLVDDPIAAELAMIRGGANDPGFLAGVNSIKQRFWDGDLSDWRTALSYGSDDVGKYQKFKMQNSRELSDAYIDSVLARVHYKTGGTYKAYEIMPDGTKHLFDDVAGEYRTRRSPNSRIEFELTQAGDSELLEHIAKGKQLQQVTAGQTKVPAFLNIDGEKITFGRNMTIEDHNKYSAWLKKKDPYEQYHVMKKSAFDLDGERINSYDAAIERLFTIVMSAPTNRLSRSPAFRQFYWKFIEENAAYFDDALRTQLLKQGKKANLGKNYANKITKTGKVTADEGNLLTIDNIDELDDAAKAYALTETKGLLYDLNKRHVVSDMLRLAFPFAEVYLEIIGTWSRLLNKKKLLAGRKITRAVEGARKTKFDDDDQGFFHVDEMTGEEMFFFPGNEALSNWMFEGNRDGRQYTNPVTGEVMDNAPDAKIRMKGYVSSLNMIAGNPAPGLGPLVAYPASKALPSSDMIDKVFFPYGRETGNPLNPLEYVEALIPSWAKKFLAIGSDDPEFNRIYQNTYKDVIKMYVTTGLYDDSTPAKQAQMLEKAKRTATILTGIRGLVQFTAPTGSVLRYEVEVAPGGALHIDPAKYKESDPKHHLFGISLVADAYYRILAKYKGDQVLATQEFVNQFGLDPTAILTSKSREIKKRSYTDEGVLFTETNKDILERYPDVGYYLYPDNPMDEFNFQAWSDAFAERDRVDLTDEEYITAIRQGQGRLAYEYQRRLLFESGYYSNISPEAKYDMLSQIRNGIREIYPGYGQTSTVASSIDAKAKTEQLSKLLQFEGESLVELPNGDKLKVKDLPSMQGLALYLERRNQIILGIQSIDGPNASLQKAEYLPLREQLRAYAQQLFSQHPDFYYVYDGVLRYEIEEDFTEIQIDR